MLLFDPVDKAVSMSNLILQKLSIIIFEKVRPRKLEKGVYPNKKDKSLRNNPVQAPQTYKYCYPVLSIKKQKRRNTCNYPIINIQRHPGPLA